MSEKRAAPYPGPRPFQAEDHSRFFGRQDAALTLAEMWQANRLTVVSGPVGSGKTSLLQAGTYPLLADKRLDILPPGRLSFGMTFPFAALPEHNMYTLALLRSWSPHEPATTLAGLTVRDFVCQRARRHDMVILAAIDQVEELQANSGLRGSHRRRFLEEIVAAVRDEPRLHLMLVVRDGSVGVLTKELSRGATCRVTALAAEDALDAVREPVKSTSRWFTEEAARQLVEDLQTSRIVGPGGYEDVITSECVEPALLQVVCAALWENLLPDEDGITSREVRAYGDADTVLSAYWSRSIATVADEHDLPARRLRSWLLCNFVSGAGTRLGVTEVGQITAGLPNAVARALADRYLLAAGTHDGVCEYELLSPRLIEPLRQAVDERPPPPEPDRYLSTAGRAMVSGELDLAERYARRALKASPDTDLRLRAEGTSLLGNIEYEREKPAAAEAFYRQAADLFQVAGDTRGTARQLAAVGQTLAAQERYREAVKELTAAVNRMPNDPVIQTELATALWQLGDGPAAVAVLTDVLGIDGGNREALRIRGEILAYLGEAKEAMLDLNRVAAQGSPSARAARGLALAELGDQSAAREEIDGVVDDTTRNGTVLLYAARARILTGDLAEAKELANRALDATDPALPPPRLDVARELAGRGPGQALP